MTTRSLALILFFLISLPALSQTPEAPEIATLKIQDLPEARDDRDSKTVLSHMIKQAGWLDSAKIEVKHGVVYITGQYKSKDHMKWLTETAEKLPTVLAVVNNATLITPAVTNMAPYINEWKNFLSKVKRNAPRVLVGITLVMFFMLLGSYLQKGLNYLWLKRVKNPFVATTVAKITAVPIWAVFFYITLHILGMQPLATTIIGGTGVAGILFGLAFKGIAENYLSGFLLAMRSPFTQGDHIKVNDFQGIVQNLNMRGTTIVDLDGNLILIPNTTVIQSVVQNFSANSIKRTSFTIEIDQKDSFQETQKIIIDVLKSIKEIKEDPRPLVVIDKWRPEKILSVKTTFWFNAEASSEATLRTVALSRIKDSLLVFGHGDEDKKVRDVARRNLKQEVTESDGARHKEELQKVARNSSLPVNDKSENLLKNLN